ncbi:hypothetical protein NW761_010629 [Fusarium oxysporum]|nr:hypothetical protein NW758_008085 [Fusarium oxysporum]KAJ4053031.1 hypothetical protein NW753_007207 [Fusarium oxysporum]KAJ4054179.1 hypothetical protein NW763_007731 [Fusarium oxysporum]KAJ4081042.1 hypothetical protein NW761_010629 [Fusarium oxysporum]KAJ4087611.1 hypothetical protein NW756_007757 [Fusarium oxysporum]
MSRRYDVDYETAARDERMAWREYMIALKAWAMGSRYNLYDLVVLAREHAIDLAELVNPIWVLEVTVDTPLAMKHITGIIHRIDDFTWDVLETTTKRQATDILLHMQPSDTVGRLWVMLQFMQKAQGPALQRGQRLVAQTLPTLLPGGINPEDDTPFEEDVDEYVEIPFDHFIPGAKIKCGKIMRAMVGSINSSQNIGTRNKEKPSKRDKYIFTVRSISSDHL